MPTRLAAAAKILASAPQIHVLAQRRAFPVACYLAYALDQLELQAHLLDGVGGMLRRVRARRSAPATRCSSPAFATTRRRSVETALRLPRARRPGRSRSPTAPLSPLKPAADVCFELGDDSTRPFRSLVAPLCLAQALVVSTGHQPRRRSRAGGRRKAAKKRRTGNDPAPFDLVCMGRAAVDLYGEQIGGRLEDMRLFAQVPGRLAGQHRRRRWRASACKPAMLTRVGDEHNGRFVRETLAAEGVDVEPRHDRSGAAHRARLPRHPRPRDVPARLLPRQLRRHGDRRRPTSTRRFIALGRGACCVSGTHLSQPRTRAACERAMALRARGAARASSSTSTTGRCSGA